jgi:hypothetical protein
MSCAKSSSSLVQPSRSSLWSSSLCVVVDNFCKRCVTVWVQITWDG